ncbi:MAG TPA: transcriptional regulator [Candidatus Kapabacteria bacterium]|jgi:DNA-binding MarR family transcriptional regulator
MTTETSPSFRLEDNTEYIRKIIAESRGVLHKDRKIYLLWATLLAVAVAVTYVSVADQRDLYIGIVWAGVALIGLLSSLYFLFQQRQRISQLETFVQKIQGLPALDASPFEEGISSHSLEIMAILLMVDEEEFTFLRDKIGETDGNLSIHLKKLEDAGYVTTRKHFVAKKPVSSYKLTRKGRKAFEEYLRRLEAMIPHT